MAGTRLLLVSAFIKLVIATNLGKPLDLSWGIDENTVYWPNNKGFEFTKKVAAVTEKGYWYASNEFCTGEHGGSHFDAPYHFDKNGMKVGEVPLERLIAPGVCIDLQTKTKKFGRDTLLTTHDIIAWEGVRGTITNGTIVLVKFGWGQYYTKEKYLYNSKKKLDFPGLSKEAAQLLADRGVYGVGVDTASVDPGSSTEFYTHRILAKYNIFGLENVKFHNNLPATGFKLYVLPMKIKEGTGGPVRIVAIPDEV